MKRSPKPSLPKPDWKPSFERERELAFLGYTRIAGVDEAGRGPLAGPVVAGAAIIPFDFSSPSFALLHDSKQLSEALRETLYEELEPHIEYGIGVVHAPEIDRINIRQASWLAMQLAVADMVAKHAARQVVCETASLPDYVLIDGLPYGAGPWPYEAIVKGDARSLSIAAASVFAKVTRDRMLVELDGEFPQYGFARHKGYPSPMHLKALQEHGPCKAHRRSYAPVRLLLAEPAEV